MPINLTQPNQGYFGISPEQVGQTEANNPSNPMLIGMMLQGKAAQQGYLQSLAATQNLEMEQAEREREKDLANTYLTTAHNNESVLPYLSLTNSDGSANPYLGINPKGIERVGALAQDSTAAQTFEHRMNGYKIAADDLGYVPGPAQIADVERGAGYMGPDGPIPGTIKQPTANAIDQQKADAQTVSAEAAKTAAANSGKNGSKTVTTMVPDGHGGFIPMSVVQTDAGGGGGTVNVIAPGGGNTGGGDGKVQVYMKGGGVRRLPEATANAMIKAGTASVTPYK